MIRVSVAMGGEKHPLAEDHQPGAEKILSGYVQHSSRCGHGITAGMFALDLDGRGGGATSSPSFLLTADAGSL